MALDEAAFLLDLASIDGTWANFEDRIAECYEEAGLRDIARFVLHRDWVAKKEGEFSVTLDRRLTLINIYKIFSYLNFFSSSETSAFSINRVRSA